MTQVPTTDDLGSFSRAIYPRLVGELRVLTPTREDAEDVAHDALVRLVDHWGRVSHLDRPDLWVRRVAHNLAKSRWRRLRTTTRVAIPVTRDDGTTDLDTFHDLDSAKNLLARLPARERQVLALRYVADLPVPDVAAIMNLSEDAVTSLTWRALSRLRRQMNPGTRPHVRHDPRQADAL